MVDFLIDFSVLTACQLCRLFNSERAKIYSGGRRRWSHLKIESFRFQAKRYTWQKPNTAHYSEHTIATVKHSMLCGCFFFSKDREGGQSWWEDGWSQIQGNPGIKLQKSRLVCKRLKTEWNGLDQSIVMYSNDDSLTTHTKIQMKICGKTCKLVFTDGLHPVCLVLS